MATIDRPSSSAADLKTSETAYNPSRSPVRSSTSSLSNGVVRARSTRGGALTGRGGMARPPAGALSLSSASLASDAEDDARTERIGLLDELRDQLKDTELKAEQFQRQAEVLQARLDEALKDTGRFEDRAHKAEEKLEQLEYEKKDAARAKREMESIYESERTAMHREREEMANREEELRDVIQHLKENLASRTTEEERRMSRQSGNSSPSVDINHFAPPSASIRSDSRNNSKIVMQKDKLIESLRLELAEAQIKLIETENTGGGRVSEVEKLLMETRMANARLIEDNESFQLLLHQKTMNGEFGKGDFGFSAVNADALEALEGRSGGASSLADELAGADSDDGDNTHRLRAELRTQQDQNKALTLYINKIIERLLQHQDFEAILDQSDEFKPGARTDKALPAPPSDPSPGLLQRAKTAVVGTPAPIKLRPRPMSQMPAAHSALTDPETAPSIPFGLGRAQSTRRQRPQSAQIFGAADVINQMYKGSSGPVSPPLSGGPVTPRHSASFFAPPAIGQNPNAAARNPSAGSIPTVASATSVGEKTSEVSSIDSGASTPPQQSPPRSEKATAFSGKAPRPLRLVEDKKAEDDKKNNRASWMGWAQGLVAKTPVEPGVESIKE